MNSEQLFHIALQLQAPWQVKQINFEESEKGKTLTIQIDYPKGSKFSNTKGELCSLYDSHKRRWQHLNFFEYRCIIESTVPRIIDSQGKVSTVQVPWAREGSGFTLAFEALIMGLIESEMPVKRVGKLLGINPDRVWTIFHYWVDQAVATDTCETLTQLGIDETSAKRGHKYITVGVDLQQSRVVGVVEGKSKTSVDDMCKLLKKKGAAAQQIAEVSMDLSPAFISGVQKTFTNASITFDRFHVVKLLNEAMSAVHRSERQAHAELKGHKYTFVRNRNTLSDKQEESLTRFVGAYPFLGEAYRLKTLFNDVWSMPTQEKARSFLVSWCEEAKHLGHTAFTKFAHTVLAHLEGIVRFVRTKMSNGVLEGINSKIQLAKRRARGFRSLSTFMSMVYFLCGKMKFNYPH